MSAPPVHSHTNCTDTTRVQCSICFELVCPCFVSGGFGADKRFPGEMPCDACWLLLDLQWEIDRAERDKGTAVQKALHWQRARQSAEGWAS